ncbi:phosphatidylinositol-glycan-specific phospholipase D [Bombina bombina]|uniref:phosphatidylinositol-glycan-specific phospholipase D n=1 Tax=Bombina bombina TaxID=8345 RepID=UPI00235A9CA2|nr:phosphatidylinositol-glycan-specific phospholipase D [Bombina bombina]
MAAFNLWIGTLFVSSFLWLQTAACGISTHIEIAHRALEFFTQPEENFNYRELIKKHPEAFQAGSVYPDAFYQGICAEGKYHDLSEDSHWTPFLKASINYIRKVYPRPWDENAQKLVSFIFGIASHMVSDVSWHSLDIDQGFLRAMAEMDFHGSYSEAHQAGDFGGDVLSQYELDFHYLEGKWYIPAKDLANIYREFYGQTVISESTIVDCTYILFLEMYGEFYAVAKLFPSYARQSPFLVERFHEYFLGGVDDMAYWSTNIFQLTGLMLDNGTSVCYVPENPIFIQCNIQKRERPFSGKIRMKANTYHKNPMPSIMRTVGANITTMETGVFFQMNSWAKNSLHILSKAVHAMNIKNIINSQSSNHVSTPSATYFVESPYARLGWALTTADINQDGQDDLIVGAPGYSTLGHVQVGRVYIVYSNDTGLPSVNMDLDKDADILLQGSELSGRFGSSVAVLDFNADGHMDVAVGAPSVGSKHLTYTGSVYVYFGSKKSGLSSEPNITIKCRLTYCNLGWSLLAADINGDNRKDLVIGSPYAPGGGKQRGLVAAFYSNRKRNRRGSLLAEEADWSIVGEHDYAWFGYSLHSHRLGNKTLLMVGSPTWSKCKSSDCEFSSTGSQSVGKAYGFYPPSTNATFLIHGEKEQSKLGSSFASGILSINGVRKQVLLVGAPSQSTTYGFAFISRDLHQAGRVTVYELGAGAEPSSLHSLSGDREFSRYGANIHLNDLDNDGLDEVIVTAPLRTDDITSMLYGVQAGRVYIYNGNVTSPGFLSKSCKSWISPCPEERAQYVLISPEVKSRFGSAVITVKSNKTRTVVVAAERSSMKARLAGTLYIYNLS